MKQLMRRGIPMSLGVIGVLFFVAGSPAIGIMPRNYANFAGLAFMMFSGLGWALGGMVGKSGQSKGDV